MIMLRWIADRFYRWKHRRDDRRPGAWEEGARARGLFPAYADWGAAMAVDGEGKVWYSEDHTAWTDPKLMDQPDIRFAALGVAVRRHPELAHVARRTAYDPVCPTCNGLGYPAMLPPKLRYTIICQCGGLGWIPAALAEYNRTIVRSTDDLHDI